MLRRLNSSSAHHHAWNPTTFFLLLLLSNSWLPLAHSSLKRSETRRSLTRHCCHIQWLESWTPTLPSILIYTYTSMVSLSLYIYNNNIHIYCIVVCIVYQIQAFTAGIIWQNAFVFHLLFRLYIYVYVFHCCFFHPLSFFYFTHYTHLIKNIYACQDAPCPLSIGFGGLFFLRRWV